MPEQELDPRRPFKQYIGDSVYADFDGYSYILTTENGYGPTNTIYLEPAVLNAFIAWWAWVGKALERAVAAKEAAERIEAKESENGNAIQSAE